MSRWRTASLPGFEPHQRPLYFDHGDIDGVDFWSEGVFSSAYGRAGAARSSPHPETARARGHMRLIKIEEVQGGPDSGVIRARFALEDPNNRVLGRRDANLHLPRR